MNPEGSRFESVYSESLERFISFKRSLGYESKHVIPPLRDFDRFCCKSGVEDAGLTSELLRAWSGSRKGESPQARYKRMAAIRQFACFLNDTGCPSYIPRLPKHPSSSFAPHIFTHDELSRLFRAVDELSSEARVSCVSVAPAMPALMRTLYATGIRSGEAVALTVGDVDLEKGLLLVRESKNGEDRIVPVSETLAEVLRDYARPLLDAAEKDDPFFARMDGRAIDQTTAYGWFRRMLERAGIPHPGGGKGPRLHDLRHTFAVHSLARMVDAGLDLYYTLPILSQYLGHKSLDATGGYVRLTEEMFPGVIRASNAICAYVLPEVADGDK